MDERVLEVGDVVRLNSGGPSMTVEALEGGAAHVVWIDDQHQTHRESFPKAALAPEGSVRPMKFR